MNNIYFDYAATTPVDPEVLEAMLPYLKESYGNPSSVHQHGRKAEGAVESARELIADLMKCSSNEIIFTSGGSESDNLALRGTALARRNETGANRIIISAVEHEAVHRTSKQLQTQYGFDVVILPVDCDGKVNSNGLVDAIGSDVAVVSVMYANNEVGTINPIEDISEVCKAKNVPFHTDAVQAFGYIDIEASDGIDLMSAGAHKFYGPKGVGFLYKKKRIVLLPTQTGGSQESGFRAGTQNVPYIVGMAKALEVTRKNQASLAIKYTNLRDRLIKGILGKFPQSVLTGSRENRLSNHASFAFPGIDGNELVMVLDLEGFSCSSGSACKTGNPEPSDVLLAMGFDRDLARGSLRLTVGRNTTVEDVERLLNILPIVIARLNK